jgi:hypothetical protein
MPRLLTLLVGLTVAFPLVAAPVPAHLMPEDPPLAFPTRVGTTWVYEGNYGKQTIAISEVTEERDGAKLVTTAYVGEDGKRTPHMVQRISAEGVFLVAEGGKRYVEPWCILKLPHRVGQKWEARHRRVGEELEFVDQMTAGPIEKVRVAAGEFSAARVDREIPFRGAVIKGTYWYAHGIGLIRLDDDMKLKSFALGKD